MTAGRFLARHLGRAPVVGDRMRLGEVDLIVRRLDRERIAEIGLALEHEAAPFEGMSALPRLRRWLAGLARAPHNPP